MGPIHQMRLTGRLASGADEWSCPTCGRRISLRQPPEPDLVVLEPGDESAVHVGVIDPDAAAGAAEKYGIGPIREIPRAPRPADPAAPPARPDPVGAEDRRWLAEIGIDWDGDAAA
ncbi:hypothetical protein AB0D08_04135 [Kitasatospora sp. NPDC048540]|uniref:hypothetical protein n=1 Tax=unclassified Kitasatospora TaxID=2633591 RepID=UPI00053B5661|nr:hypothetical protein [Kitasatospora sp. MBT63]